MTVYKVTLRAFNCKKRPSGVTLKSPGLENIPEFPRNGAEYEQNRNAGNGDFDKLRLNFPEFGGYFPLAGSLY